MRSIILSLLIASVSFGATPDIEFRAPSGLTLDLQLSPVGADSLTDTANCTERTNKPGWYLATTDGTPTLSGTYAFQIVLDGTTTAIGGGYVTVADDESTYQPHLAPSQSAVTVGTVTDVTTKTGYALADATSDSVIADAVWNALKANYGGSLSYGEHVEALTTGGATASAIWDYDISAISTAGYAGDYLNNVTSTTVDVTVVGPVLETEELSLVYGDDYSDALGRRLEWSSTGWPDLTSATIVFSMRETRSQTVVMSSIAGTVVAAGVGTQTVGVEIASADWATADANERNYEYDVQGTIGGEKITLVRDTATVTDDVTD